MRVVFMMFITTRKQSLEQGNVFYTFLSFCPQEVLPLGEGSASGGLYPGGGGSLHPGGVCIGGGVLGRTLHRILRDTVNNAFLCYDVYGFLKMDNWSVSHRQDI